MGGTGRLAHETLAAVQASQGRGEPHTSLSFDRRQHPAQLQFLRESRHEHEPRSLSCLLLLFLPLELLCFCPVLGVKIPSEVTASPAFSYHSPVPKTLLQRRPQLSSEGEGRKSHPCLSLKLKTNTVMHSPGSKKEITVDTCVYHVTD